MHGFRVASHHTVNILTEKDHWPIPLISGLRGTWPSMAVGSGGGRCGRVIAVWQVGSTPETQRPECVKHPLGLAAKKETSYRFICTQRVVKGAVMKKAYIFFMVFFVFILTSCAETRYMMGSFRKVADVAPKNKHRKTAIITMGDIPFKLNQFENDLRALGYNYIGNISNCYTPKYNSLFGKRGTVTSEVIYHSAMNCGEKVGAEVVIKLHGGARERQQYHSPGKVLVYTQIELWVDIFDIKKGKWLVHNDTVPLEYDKFLRTLE